MREGNRKEISLFLLLCFLSGFLFFLDKKGWLKPMRGLVERPILAIEKEIYNTRNIVISQYRNIFLSKTSLKKELLRLQIEVQKLAVDQNKLLSCQQENEKIKKLLGTPLPASWKFLPAQITGVTDQMRLDKGEKDGVKTGMNVLSENILIGKVAKTGEHDSLVQLPNSNETKIPVIIKRTGQSVQARGLLIGQVGGQLILDKVLQTEDIQKGDLVVSSGDEGWLPNLVIGEVSDVLGKSAEVYQKVRVRPLADYDQLSIVFLVFR